MGIVEYPPKAFRALKRQQLLTVAIALEDQRDRALAENEKLRAQISEACEQLADMAANAVDTHGIDSYSAQRIRDALLAILGEPDGSEP